ncbi:MAG: hypothetical protein JHC93_03755, partial [Parachlamydiales bacterium]|nr:hypothetical protein [Parachlamydiales bacterium]
EEAFLGRVFDQLIINSNADEVDTILVEYRKNLPVIKSSAFKTQSLFEKFLNKVTNFVKNPGFKKIIASVGALAALVFFNAYGIQGVVKNLPKLSNFLKKNLPAKICRATSYIYNRVWVIGLTSVFVACVTPQASKINKIATVIRDIAIMLLFWPIILPLKLAILVYNLIHKGVSYTSQSMASGKNVLEARRISKELHHARKLWVDGVKNSRVFLRKPDGTVYNSPQIAQSA